MRGFEPLSFKPNFLRTILIILVLLVPIASICAQTPASPTSSPETNQEVPNTNSAPNGIESRIQRARALAAAHQLQPAINELEAVRRMAPDDVIRNVTSVMLMGIYLEEGNYIRAQSLLDEDFRARASGRDADLRTYFAIAGQAINGARLHLARYRSFGINVSDQSLPPEAISDLDRLRSLLERMAAQAKEIVAARKAYDALALLEDVIGVRLIIARDAEDRGTWEAEYATARQGLALAQTQIASLGVPTLWGGSRPITSTPTKKEPPPAAKEPTVSAPPQTQTQIVDTTLSASESSPQASAPTEEKSEEEPVTVSTGLLNTRASKRVVPAYPPMAKTAGVSGLVRVHVVIDEDGKVVEVTSSEGPVLLRPAAEQAARTWRFPPTVLNSKPVRLSGYIEFNFTR